MDELLPPFASPEYRAQRPASQHAFLHDADLWVGTPPFVEWLVEHCRGLERQRDVEIVRQTAVEDAISPAAQN